MRPALCVFSLVAACGGSPARQVQQSVPTVASVDPQAPAPPSVEACKTAERADLMVVDWTPELRGDLEVAMKQGLAVVAYDCKSVKLVPCASEAAYAFIGTTRREKKIEMSSADEVAANLPVGGLTWLSDVGGRLDRKRAILAQLVMVGKRTTPSPAAAAFASCSGGTHYVRAATIGAFAVASGTQAELGAAATVLGKGAKADSKSSTKITASDGELAACATSTPDDKAPPAQCGALVRVELEPIASSSASADLAATACAPGFAMSTAGGACVRLDKPHQCKPGDGAECATQCEAGDAGSCATLAVMHRDGVGVAKDATKASALGERACAGDVALGCRVAATGKAKIDLALLAKACDAGDGAGCVELGIARLADKRAAGDAQYAFRRACYGGGSADGCAWLGGLYVAGKGGLTASPKVGAQFLVKGCKDRSGKACHDLAELTRAGKGVAKDAARAKQLFAEACALGIATDCAK
jgi:uncharacterized protein